MSMGIHMSFATSGVPFAILTKTAIFPSPWMYFSTKPSDSNLENLLIDNKMNVKLCMALSGNDGNFILKRDSNLKWITRLFSKTHIFGINIL